jgi:alkylation response protein AidB-like acyl-CoA dehydrogenase
MHVPEANVETVEDFRSRLRTWLPDGLPRAEATGWGVGLAQGLLSDDEELADVAHQRQLQRRLFDAGFAGICFPKEYGGQGLTPDHQQAFNEEIWPYEYPSRFQVPTLQPCATVLLDYGTEEQKRQHLPAILCGDEIWMQLLSEPTGGSDVAGAQTTALRDGDEWVLNGSKIWTTGAWWADWGLCLARSNWDVPKHRGLTVFMLRLHQPDIEVHRIEMLNGSREFCQEFLTDVRVPDTDRIGEVDQGWTVGTRWMFYEKSYGMSSFTTRPTPPDGGEAGGGLRAGSVGATYVSEARQAGRLNDAVTRELIGEAHALSLASSEGISRIGKAMANGKLSNQAAGLTKIIGGTLGIRQSDIGLQLTGPSAAAWTEENERAGERGTAFLVRQTGQIAGGTGEMARNVVSERLLGMPRELTVDRDTPFRDIPRGPAAH